MCVSYHHCWPCASSMLHSTIGLRRSVRDVCTPLGASHSCTHIISHRLVGVLSPPMCLLLTPSPLVSLLLPCR
jgi:hypothetical protein